MKTTRLQSLQAERLTGLIGAISFMYDECLKDVKGGRYDGEASLSRYYLILQELRKTRDYITANR